MRYRGSLTLRLLLSLLICLTMLPIVLTAFRISEKLDFYYQDSEDAIAKRQLQKIVLLAYDIQIKHDELVFQYQEEEFRLSMINRHVVLQPGTQIFYENLDDCYFLNEDGFIKIVYQRKDKVYVDILGKADSFSIKSFPDRLSESDLIEQPAPVSSADNEYG